MKILHLTLKKKWFDLIASGEKKEEYRELKEYWYQRFFYSEIRERNNSISEKVYTEPKRFDAVEFKHGYSEYAPMILVELKGIEIGHAKPEWSDNWKGEVFVIKLGEIIEKNF